MGQIEKLSLKLKLGYGAGEFASSIFWITMAFWLMNFMTDEVGLSATLAGVAIMVGKALDAIIDPAVGFLSDRTQSRWGRRRPWFLFGAIPFGITYFIMFTNFHLTGQAAIFTWESIAFILLCLTYSCTNVPFDTVTVLSVEVVKARETSQNKSNPNKLMKEISLENQSNQKR